MNAQALIEHVLGPVVTHPDSLEFNVIQGNAVMVVELTVHDEDVSLLTKNDSALLESLQHLLTVSAGKQKTSLELINTAS
jgi:predicted RNA-binding protein YlqC (UPF0109 family)